MTIAAGKALMSPSERKSRLAMVKMGGFPGILVMAQKAVMGKASSLVVRIAYLLIVLLMAAKAIPR